ncbi:Sulfate Permease Family [Micractinium conductrix]|uniref:Sulfate Permease Family n=1 Tax=Micractinium conductrix TaxID=554055 RepID=A0A2P6VN11_9CHLO|nr:Sulfate Permease Family [Micractinium conductrix]|eukprot:PSC75492.1 Sulfate Permease Family [Micractinium conductrix]
MQAAVGPSMPLGDPDSNREQQGPAALPHLRTATSPAPAPPRPTAADSGGGGTLTPPDSWTASGPFRNAPMRHLLHATPSGTPLASPRSGTPPDDRGGDLEAPLLGRVRGKRGGGAQQQPFDSGGALRAITFGLINTAAGVPALIAFCAVVFKHPLYHSQVEPLCKLFFLASALHQAVVCLRSSIPNAVGQVQDVGLIFLSSMATSIATLVPDEPAAALGTALLTMAASTLLVGMGLIAVAKFKLASAVQFLPLPAVGGYLGYVGYFCVASGLGLGCGVQLGPLASWAQLGDPQVALRVLPTLGSTALMMFSMARCKHPLALPGVLLLIVALFHAALLAMGVTLADAQAAGWVLPPAASSGQFWVLWRLFDMPGGSLANIRLGAAVQQVGKLVGLFLLVCFGSCMDIAAIQSDTPFRLDFNKELTTIGLSNMVSGAVGCGFTGSLIFSQTIFTGRAGVLSRWNGAVIAAAEFAMFALPVSIVQYLPTFFFGSLLVWFGVEIVMDWMVHSYRKLSRPEYCLLWATFGAIMQWGLEAGIAAGIVLATLYFAWAYAKSQLSSFALVPGRASCIVRAADQEAALELLRPSHLLCAQLRGFLFFGVSHAISTRLHAAARRLDAGLHGAEEGVGQEEQWAGGASGGANGGANGGGSAWRAQQAAAADRLYTREGSKHGGALWAAANAPKFLLLDFTRVKGIDATAARTLGSLFRDLAQLEITPVVTAAAHHCIRELLLAHGAPLPPTPAASAQDATPFMLRSAAADTVDAFAAQQHCHEFASCDEGLRFCEQQLLAVAVRGGLCRPPSEAVTLEQLLRAHVGQARLPFAGRDDCGDAAAQLAAFVSCERYRPGDELWREGQPADELFIVEQGRLVVEQRVMQPGVGGEPPAAAAVAAAAAAAAAAGGCYARGDGLPAAGSSGGSLGAAGGGGGAGGSGACRVLRLTRDALGRMAAEAPAALHILQAVVLRANCLDLGTAAELAIS